MCGNDSTYVCKPHMEIELWPHLKIFMIYSHAQNQICKFVHSLNLRISLKITEIKDLKLIFILHFIWNVLMIVTI